MGGAFAAAIETGVTEHRVEQQVDGRAAGAMRVDSEDLAELALGIHVDRENSPSPLEGEIRSDVRDQGGLGASALLIDEGDTSRREHSPP